MPVRTWSKLQTSKKRKEKKKKGKEKKEKIHVAHVLHREKSLRFWISSRIQMMSIVPPPFSSGPLLTLNCFLLPNPGSSWHWTLAGRVGPGCCVRQEVRGGGCRPYAPPVCLLIHSPHTPSRGCASFDCLLLNGDNSHTISIQHFQYFLPVLRTWSNEKSSSTWFSWIKFQ